MNVLEKLRQLVGEVANPPADESWALAQRLLSRMPVDGAERDRVCAEKDAAGLDALVSALENPTPAPGKGADVPEPQMRAALKAFKKRLKLARLNDESRIGGRQLTGGHKSEIDAIIPPREYSKDVWEALVRDGELKNTGQGFYALRSN